MQRFLSPDIEQSGGQGSVPYLQYGLVVYFTRYLAYSKLLPFLGIIDLCHTHLIQRFNVVVITLYQIICTYEVERLVLQL